MQSNPKPTPEKTDIVQKAERIYSENVCGCLVFIILLFVLILLGILLMHLKTLLT